MRLSIRVKLFLMINSLVILLAILLMSFSTIFIDDILINKYREQEIKLYSKFQSKYMHLSDMGEIIKNSSVVFRGFASIIDSDLHIKESNTPGVRREGQLQTEFKESALKVIENPDIAYETFVLDALHGEGNTMLLVGRLNERDYIILDKPLNYVNEVVDLINSAMLTFLFLLLLLGLVISYLTSFVFTRPILNIRMALQAIANKDFSHRLNIKNNDELGDLGHLINEISDQIRDNFDEIEAQNEMLDKDKTMLEEMNKQLQDLSETDTLTKLNNRLKVDRVLECEVERAKRSGTIFSVIIIDIDHFKVVNDSYGHLVGDKVLVQIATILKENSRRLDVAGRWGGEEFIIVLPDTSIEGAFHKAEKFRVLIEECNFGEAKGLTASFGVGEYDTNLLLKDFLKNVDHALYQAKENGRNRVEKFCKI